MADDHIRPLACAIAIVLVLGSLMAVLRSGDGRSGAVAAVGRSGDESARMGRAPADQLPLSDPQSLDLVASGYVLPLGASVYAARVVDGGDRPLYVDYVAGGGALARDFWPASSIKLLAALGALDFAASLGFTGAATVSFDTGYPGSADPLTIRELSRSAVRDSDNLDYDILIRIAGFDRLNSLFLSPANGFPLTVIQRSYAGIDVRSSPRMTLQESGRTVVVAPRVGKGDYDCPDDGNCSNLFELSEAVRRLVLDRSIPAEERLPISSADVRSLMDSLADTGSFFSSGVEQAVGPGATVQSKPGVAAGLACVDTAVVTGANGDRYLLSAAIPESDADFDCEGLSDLAAAVLPLLASP